MKTRLLAVAGAMALVGAFSTVVTAGGSEGAAVSAAPACAATDPGGGSWPAYGHDLSNTRTQPLETTIGTANVTNLAPKWTFTTSSSGGGTVETTPVVADGCLFVGSSTGRVFALNADTGDVVWSNQVISPGAVAGYGGLIVGAPAVDSAAGLVIVAVNQIGSPYLVALNEATGTAKWTSPPADSKADGDWGNVAGENASPTVWAGKVFLGFYGSEFDPRARGGYAIFDEATGNRIAHTYTITDANYALGYRGSSVWTTAAVDPVAGVAYVGTGNPGGEPAPGTSPAQFPQCAATPPGQACHTALEDPMSDSLLKVDVDPSHTATFGKVLNSYKGNPDNYSAALYNTPLCALLGSKVEVSTSPPSGAWSVPCGQVDLDFGASPNLFVNPAGGGAVVGDLQKSGVYHVANTSDMSSAWKTIVGLPCPACNGSSAAAGPGGEYTGSSPGGLMVSLSGSGGYQWASPIGDAVHYESVSNANGVVYTVDNFGFLDAFDATHGLPLARRSLPLDIGGTPSVDLSSAGVSIARHTVYAGYGDGVVAYQPGPLTLPKLPSPSLPAGSPIVAGPLSFLLGYYTPTAAVPAGGSISFDSFDIASHNVTAFDPATGHALFGPDTPACAANGYKPGFCPLFFTKTISTGGSAALQNTSQLQPGKSYAFFCTIHPLTMRGTLTVT